MAIGRYLTTDTGRSISGIGRTIADLTGQVLSVQQMAEQRADRERRRRLQESREERLARSDLEQQERRDLATAEELMSTSPERRALLTGTLSPGTRKRLGFAEAIPAATMTVQPPTVPGAAGPTTIETPHRPQVDPFMDLPADESITYRQSTFPTREDYLDFRTDEERARYAGRPARLSGPSGQKVDRVAVRNVLDAAARDEYGELTIAPGDYASIMSRALAGELTMEDIPSAVGSAPPTEREDGFFGPDDEPGDEGDGKPWWKFWGDGDEEPEVRPTGGLAGPGASLTDTARADASRVSTSPAELTSEQRSKVRTLLDRGTPPATIAQALAAESGIDEDAALALVESEAR